MVEGSDVVIVFSEPFRMPPPGPRTVGEMMDMLRALKDERDALMEENRDLRSKLASISAYNWDLQEYT